MTLLSEEFRTYEDDKFIVLAQHASWADYQNVLQARGDVSSPRINFVDGYLELMTPSQDHEGIKSIIGCLIDVFCDHSEIECSKYGSWTIGRKEIG
jgi:Uma2 family endonuclease